MYVSDYAELFTILLEYIQDEFNSDSRCHSFLSRLGNELGDRFELIVQRLVRNEAC